MGGEVSGEEGRKIKKALMFEKYGPSRKILAKLS